MEAGAAGARAQPGAARNASCAQLSPGAGARAAPERRCLGRASSSTSPAPAPAAAEQPRRLSAADVLSGVALRGEGETVRFPRPLVVGDQEFTQATVLRDFRTASRAKLVRLHPSGKCFICKFADLRQERALMCAVRAMNYRWRQQGVAVCGVPVEALAYDITPLDAEVGLVEAVLESKTLQELSQDYTAVDRHLRVVDELRGSPKLLDRLAATTVGCLTMSYVLGIRDSHDENLMLRSDGSFFRVDFGFAFGDTPEIDAPLVFVPQAVAHALGPSRWAACVAACGPALMALTSDNVRTLTVSEPLGLFRSVGEAPPGWDCLRCVPELGPLLGHAKAYVDTLDCKAFEAEVRRADEWSLARSAKNTVRQTVRFLTAARDARLPKDWLAALDLSFLVCQHPAAGGRALAPGRASSGRASPGRAAAPGPGTLGEGL